ncbi:MAG: Hsp20/alpha crystallin family protein [Thermoanaerobaculia bacterium]
MNGLTRWDPFQEINWWNDRLSRILGAETARTARPDGELALTSGNWLPPVDIVEGKDRIKLDVELPGFKENQVNLTVENGMLTVKGERKFEKDDKAENYHRVERSYGTFVRSFSLPTSIDPNRIQADFSDGILHIEMPKREETRPKQIPIAGGKAGKKKEIDVQSS